MHLLTISAPSSVGKGQDLIVSGTFLDVGGVAAANEEIEFEIWEPYNGRKAKLSPL